jgi:hypothetical protein
MTSKKNASKKRRKETMPASPETSDIFLLTSSSLLGPRYAPETRPSSQIASAEKNLVTAQTISEFTEIFPTARKAGNVDTWGGDIVGRWLSEDGLLKVSGWAVDEQERLPAAKVFLVREGTILANAKVDKERPDVGEAWSDERLADSGWTLKIEGHRLGEGDCCLEMYALMRDAESVVKLGSNTVRVSSGSSLEPIPKALLDKLITKRLLRDAQSGKWPKMSVDYAYANNGEIHVMGWALSPAGVRRVNVYCEDKFVAPAFLGYPRPDVQARYPFVRCGEKPGFTLNKKIGPSAADEARSIRVVVIDRLNGKLEKTVQIES